VYQTIQAQQDSFKRSRISTGRTTQEVRVAEKAKAEAEREAKKAQAAGASA
jgi:hypothetical protein